MTPVAIRQFKIPVGGGEVSAEMATASPPAGTTVILAHGAGNDMRTPFLTAMQMGLAAEGFSTLRFNFPYKERGGRPPDPTRVLEDCYRTVIEWVRRELMPQGGRLVIGGKSMGGRIASHLAAAGEAVDGLLLLGYPLHPAGKPEQRRDAHLPRIPLPMLFLVGTRDALCRLDFLRPTIATLNAPITMHVIEGGDHSFDLPKSLKRERADVWAEIVAASVDWLRRF